MDVESQDQLAHFQRRLGETRVWCASQDWSANPAEGLRTALFRPSEQAGVEQTFPDYSEFWGKKSHRGNRLLNTLPSSELLCWKNKVSLSSRLRSL